jgi:NAD(P)-dependent dehydrogenase (short-subunit alcohol dehydrogenase family)
MGGRSALVTGAGRGYGREVAVGLARAGYLVGVLGRDPATMRALADELGGVPLLADVRDESGVAAAVEQFAAAGGPPDVLVNNAGLQGPDGPAWEVPAAEWWDCLEVNVRGAHQVTAAVVPHMIGAGGGRIINIVSHAGVARWPLKSAYAVSKAALIKYAETLAVELRRYGIAIVSYHPGVLEIGFATAIVGSEPEPGTYQARHKAWFEGERAAGRVIDTARSLDGLIRLAEGAADRLSGRYVSAYDDLDEVVHQVESGPDNAFTLGLIR